jgi:PKD repeat protein
MGKFPRFFGFLFVLALPVTGEGRSQAEPSAAPTSGGTPLTVTFSPNSSSGSLYQWQFNFNPAAGFAPDYSSEIGEDVLYTYETPGIYVARLRVYDVATGLPADTDFTITVLSTVPPPAVTLSASPSPVQPGQTVTFNAAATAAPGRSIVSYSWDFDGDGAPDAAGPSPTITHSYDRMAIYTPSVTARDSEGIEGAASVLLRVGTPPAVSLANPTIRLAAQNQEFSLTAFAVTDAPLSLQSYSWDFGDGTGAVHPSSTSSDTAAHTFVATGDFTVSVTVTNTAGLSSSDFLSVHVINPPGILLVQDEGIAYSTKPGVPSPIQAIFTVMAFPGAGQSITSYGWDFTGDGTNDLTSPGGYSAAVSWTWSDSTGAQATVKAYRNSQVILSTTLTVVPVAARPVPGKPGVNDPVISDPVVTDPAISLPGISGPVEIRVGHEISFAAHVKAANDQTTLQTVRWDFDGDGLADRTEDLSGLNAVDVSATCQYRVPGCYTARITVFQNGGNPTEIVIPVTVVPGTAPIECWISQPWNGTRVWGNHVTIQARPGPAALAAEVEFRYRPVDGPGDWKRIGTVVPPPYASFSIPWNVTRLTPGSSYELLAVAKDASGMEALSSNLQKVVVTVDPLAPDVEEYEGNSSSAGIIRVDRIVPGVATRTEIARDTAVELPAHALPDYGAIRLERPFSNPHPLEARLQGLSFVPGSFRRLSLGGGAGLQQSAKIGLYDLNPGGALDGLGVDLKRLRIYQFDTLKEQWVPLPGQVIQPAEDLARATLVSMGDVGLAFEPSSRTPSDSSSGGCGLLGPELLLLALLAARRRPRV